MQPAPLPPNEAERLAALVRCNVLDTPPEERFDRITRLLGRLLDVPIAIVSLLDASRSWFKSSYGLAGSEVPRELTFCGHTILEPAAALVVEDATQDPRFARNPLVLGEPEIRFYAGQPLRTPAGFALGTLCVIDRRPRSLTPHQLELLEDFAHVIGDEIELSRSLSESVEREAQLQRQNADLQDLARALSHDLAGPLRRVRTLCQLAREGEFPDADEFHELAGKAAEAGEDLVTSLQEYFTAGEVSLAPVSADDAWRAARDQLSAAIEAAGATVEAEPLPVVSFSLPVLTTVFVNLLSNALKYRDPARPPEVRVSCRELPGEVVFSVRDNGLGIPAAQRERVFELLVRLHGSSEIPGSGMGLAICSKLIDRAGGRMGVESAVGEGSRFWFSLPRRSLEG